MTRVDLSALGQEVQAIWPEITDAEQASFNRVVMKLMQHRRGADEQEARRREENDPLRVQGGKTEEEATREADQHYHDRYHDDFLGGLSE